MALAYRYCDRRADAQACPGGTHDSVILLILFDVCFNLEEGGFHRQPQGGHAVSDLPGGLFTCLFKPVREC